VLHKILKPEEIPSTSISTTTGEAILHAPIARKPRQSSFTLDSAMLDQEHERRMAILAKRRASSPGLESGNDSDIEQFEFEVDQTDITDDPRHHGRFRIRLQSHSSAADSEARLDQRPSSTEPDLDSDVAATHEARIARVKAEYVLSGKSRLFRFC